MNPSKLTRNVFEIDYRNCNYNWCYEIKQLFTKVGKIELYNNKSFCDIHDMQNTLQNIWTNNFENEILQTN